MWGRPHNLPPCNDRRPLRICFLPLMGRRRYRDGYTCIGISGHISWILCQWTYSIYIWCIYDILYLIYDIYLMHDIIRLMTLLVLIWYVCSCTTLLVIIIYYEIAWVLVPTPLVLVPMYPSTGYSMESIIAKDLDWDFGKKNRFFVCVSAHCLSSLIECLISLKLW